jgi:hypothetical protein
MYYVRANLLGMYMVSFLLPIVVASTAGATTPAAVLYCYLYHLSKASDFILARSASPSCISVSLPS